MSSEYSGVYVWIWLPGNTEPVVAGKLTAHGKVYLFNYGKSYLQREDAIPIFDVELPLRQGILPLMPGLVIPGCLVILNKRLGSPIAATTDPAALDELTYLMESGSDRIGALDFQLSPTEYVPRLSSNAPLEELIEAAELVQKGIPLTPELAQALQHGTSIGGARPKVLIEGDGKKYIAKFSTSSDTYSVVKAEFLAMRLAAMAGIDTAPVQLRTIAGKDVLLVERFDRTSTPSGWERKIILSALTLSGLDEMMARYASYEILAEQIRSKFSNPRMTLRELFSRISFNILVGNTDDHARNHAALWNGLFFKHKPAYDICPQPRHGGEASQAMLITGEKRLSRIANCLEAAPHFLLHSTEAERIIRGQIACIADNWDRVSEEASLTTIDRTLLWRNQILNPDIATGLEPCWLP